MICTNHSKENQIETLEQLNIHDHLCSIYETKEEQFSVIVPFIKIGLERGEKCIYVVNDNSVHEIQDAMQTGGIDTDSALKSGSLNILKRQEYFLKQDSFEPDWMIQFLKETTDSAKSEGFNALRLTAEMTWFFGVDQGIERLVEFESKINSLFSENDIVAICQYNRSHFTPEIILNTIQTHPIVIYGSLVCKNFYYVPPDEYLKPEQTSLEIDRLLNNIRTREQKELELKENEEILRKITSSALDAIIMMDDNGKITFWNEAAEKMFGYSKEEVIGKDLHKLIVPERFYEEYLKGAEKLKKSGIGGIIGKIISMHDLKKDGTEFLAEHSFSTVNIKDKWHAISIIRDITESKRIEDKLHKLSHAIEQSSSTIVITDTKGCIEYANPRFTQLTGYTHEEVIGKNPRVLKSGKISPEVYKELWKTIKSGNEWRGEFCNRKKNGELYWESASISPVKNDKSKIANFIAVKDDITEHKKMQEVLLQSEKLKSIGRITAGVSHEFNNILAIISGNVELLEGTYNDHGELTEALRIIKRAINDGAEISGRMLKFTKTVKDTIGFVSFDIRALVEQSIEFAMPRWKNMAQAKGINYHMDKEDMKSVSSIMCNPTEIREVFINIINNALDAMPEGGSISFNTWSGEDTVFIGISDTGEGMSEEVRKNIFDPFFTTKTPVGTGLGMSMGYGIITRHGGKIEVESEVGKGTTFTLQFPTTNKKASLIATPEPEQETNKKNLRILVVDDEKDICNILDKFLSRAGYKVKTVDNGADAIELMKREEFDLALCDLAMPDVFGYDVIKALNGLEKRPKIGIITGWTERLKPIEEGIKVDFIIKKPFNLSKLRKQINDLNI